jgi:hypothetical protein
MFEEIKQQAKPDFFDISLRLYQVDVKHEFSFISKMIHTAWPDQPIYDSRVDKTLGLNRNYIYEIKQKLEQDRTILKSLSVLYQELLGSHMIDDILDAFDQKFPNNQVSAAKKIDFLLWALGSIEMRNEG